MVSRVALHSTSNSQYRFLAHSLHLDIPCRHPRRLHRDRLCRTRQFRKTLVQLSSPINSVEEPCDPVTRDPFPVRRVLLKISGEALQGAQGCGIDPTVLKKVALEIRESHMDGHQIAVVVGGGNFFRGADAFAGIDRSAADHVGMLATIMNAICLQSILENLDVPTRLQTAIDIREVAEPYIRRRAIRHLEKGRVVIFGAGTGNPYFSTDTAAALRAAEIGVHEILKATKVKGVYTTDPTKDSSAEFLNCLSYDRALQDRLRVMDHTALTLCRDHSIPVRVFSIFVPGNISRAIRGEKVGSVMKHQEDLVKTETDPNSQLLKMNRTWVE